VGVPKKPTGFFGYVPRCLNPVYSWTKCGRILEIWMKFWMKLLILDNVLGMSQCIMLFSCEVLMCLQVAVEYRHLMAANLA